MELPRGTMGVSTTYVKKVSLCTERGHFVSTHAQVGKELINFTLNMQMLSTHRFLEKSLGYGLMQLAIGIKRGDSSQHASIWITLDGKSLISDYG